MRLSKTNAASISALLFLCIACATTQSRFASLDGKSYPPKSPTAEIAVFATDLPTRPFERIARLDVHLEKTGFTQSTLSEALPELLKQARAAGADAIVEMHQQTSSVAETRILHVTATAVRFTTDRQDAVSDR